MNIKLNYNEKEISVKAPDNFKELLNQIQKIFSIEEKLLTKINLYYYDEENDKSVLLGDEDLRIFIESADNNSLVKIIYCEIVDKNEENKKDKEIENNKDKEIAKLKKKMEELQLKNKEELDKKNE